jgi:hypothetical protein
VVTSKREREQQRAALVPPIAKALRARDFRSEISKALGSHDRHVIIVSLPDDSVGYVFDKLHDAGGAAVVVMPRADHYEIAFLAPASAARMEVALEDDTYTPVSRDSDVGMLFVYLGTVKSAVVSCVRAHLSDAIQQPA